MTHGWDDSRSCLSCACCSHHAPAVCDLQRVFNCIFHICYHFACSLSFCSHHDSAVCDLQRNNLHICHHFAYLCIIIIILQPSCQCSLCFASVFNCMATSFKHVHSRPLLSNMCTQEAIKRKAWCTKCHSCLPQRRSPGSVARKQCPQMLGLCTGAAAGPGSAVPPHPAMLVSSQ